MIHELRIYTATNGRMNDLMARFRDHTMALFEKHGIQNVAYWRNSIGGRNDELWYMLSDLIPIGIMQGLNRKLMDL